MLLPDSINGGVGPSTTLNSNTYNTTDSNTFCNSLDLSLAFFISSCETDV
jgi:hypothetical protein